MEIKNVNTGTNIKNISASPQNTLDKNAFLKILATQLRNRDMDSSQDNTAYIAQMAQFSSLEQMQNLNDVVGKLLLSQNSTVGATYLNKEVEFRLSDDSTMTEIVKAVRYEDSTIYLLTDSGKYSVEQVVQVGVVENDQQNS